MTCKHGRGLDEIDFSFHRELTIQTGGRRTELDPLGAGRMNTKNEVSEF